MSSNPLVGMHLASGDVMSIANLSPNILDLRNKFKFSPAAPEESLIYGARRPGYPSRTVPTALVQEWISFLKHEGVERVCCLLGKHELNFYEDNLLELYEAHFGSESVCWAPIPDYRLCDEETLNHIILPFLDGATRDSQPTVVHCSGGFGRTGHVLAAWLVHGRGFAVHEAMATIRKMGRDPLEAVRTGHALMGELLSLLDSARPGYDLTSPPAPVLGEDLDWAGLDATEQPR
jgi:protein-tyrosine phosphatase